MLFVPHIVVANHRRHASPSASSDKVPPGRWEDSTLVGSLFRLTTLSPTNSWVTSDGWLGMDDRSCPLRAEISQNVPSFACHPRRIHGLRQTGETQIPYDDLRRG